MENRSAVRFSKNTNARLEKEPGEIYEKAAFLPKSPLSGSPALLLHVMRIEIDVCFQEQTSWASMVKIGIVIMERMVDAATVLEARAES